MVAEEVQRLAERSGEATKQIDAIVKTIQADTQDAVAAMERSRSASWREPSFLTPRARRWTKSGACRASSPSLIGGISAQTQKQSASVSDVTRGMQGILKITEETTEGTKQTNVSIGQLTKLAAELRSSVAGFKVISVSRRAVAPGAFLARTAGNGLPRDKTPWPPTPARNSISAR